MSPRWLLNFLFEIVAPPNNILVWKHWQRRKNIETEEASETNSTILLDSWYFRWDFCYQLKFEAHEKRTHCNILESIEANFLGCLDVMLSLSAIWKRFSANHIPSDIKTLRLDVVLIPGAGGDYDNWGSRLFLCMRWWKFCPYE